MFAIELNNFYRPVVFLIGIFDLINSGLYLFQAVTLVLLAVTVTHCVALFSMTFWVAVDFFFLYGVYRKKIIFAVPWIIFSIVGLVCEFVLLLYSAFHYYLPGLPETTSPLLVLFGFAIELVMVAIVIFYYKQHYMVHKHHHAIDIQDVMASAQGIPAHSTTSGADSRTAHTTPTNTKRT